MEIKNNKTVHAYISKTILEVLSRDIIDDERIFTFSIYMHMMAIKSCFPVHNEAMEVMDEIYTYWINNYSNENASRENEEELNEEELNDLYINNQELLMEIYNDVCNNDSSDFQWLSDWGKVCKNAFDKNNSIIKNCIEFSNTLNAHLEASFNEFIITIYLIKRVLQSGYDPAKIDNPIQEHV